ncbi:enoyl-CoA hydratase-related protein [bacterium]|jgi:enoyl-CoA hydratase|nr:enoyl-CoA hydratase [Acidimicrobiaceae bacterium]MCH9805235.1 enoyl-CoA hydratase/isomerase family protein [bacterium]MDA9359601.1 enoyl-CoA hydratase-related protein [bacterium]MDB2392428.1 enoyl-CoA hydratase-related protein [Acidimicrobiaceae bacterium]
MAEDDALNTERIRTEVFGHTLVVTMVRHTKRNAIDGEMTQAIDAAMNRLDDDPELWVGILTGGPDMFCAGTDMAATSGRPTERGGIYGVVGRHRAKPLIAAVEGVAFGGGFEVVMACDMVIAANNARFALPEVKRGLVASSGALFRASRVLPLNVAKYLLTTGTELSPVEAERHGLVNEVCEPGQALERALALAEVITSNSPVAARLALQAVDQIVAADDDRAWAISADFRNQVMASEDSKEGVAAFFEKRPPRWTGR